MKLSITSDLGNTLEAFDEAMTTFGVAKTYDVTRKKYDLVIGLASQLIRLQFKTDKELEEVYKTLKEAAYEFESSEIKLHCYSVSTLSLT